SRSNVTKQKLSIVHDDIKQLESDLFLTTPQTHTELCEWLEKADEWVVKFDRHSRDSDLQQVHQVVIALFSKLTERYAAYQDKKRDWEEDCSYNLAYYYPTHGFSLSHEEYSAIFDSNIEKFDLYDDIAEKI